MEALKQNSLRIISIKNAKSLVILTIIAFLFNFFFFAMPVLADEAVAAENMAIEDALIDDGANLPVITNSLPENNNWKVKYTTLRVITSYNSEASQCDASPCITANGFNVCKHGEEDTIAANFLKFGTKVRIPDLFGDRVFVVRDRMNSRFADRVDIWMKDKQDAKKFGVKTAKLEILE